MKPPELEKGEMKMEATAKKPYRGISMEGGLATWYAKVTRKDLGEFERLARELAKDLPANARVLEIAPGPGYLSVALAKLGPFKITGLDISQSFVRMASEYAKREGVVARFIHGSASDIPLEDGLFDLVVCRAAFKNFSEPLRAVNEMHRVLKPGGRAIIIDLRKDASWNEIEAYVDGLHISAANSWFMKFTFKHMLLKRAYTEEQVTALARESDFKSCEIVKAPVGMDIKLTRRQPIAEQAA
jgi:ubiquinone/menaquinone biosynthesis C-methylase UbiE